jgi:hypothetical protein
MSSDNNAVLWGMGADIVRGTFGGFSLTIVGHPFDTGQI